MSDAPLVEARSVSVQFHAGSASEVLALVEVSVAVARGAFLAVKGPSGCGKTTLLAVLGTMQRPDAGTVLFDGADLADASQAERSRLRRRMGFAFQGAPMLRGLPLWENVTYGLVPSGEGRSARREIAQSLFERTGLGARATSLPEELSAGERQRAGLARALAGRPEVLFADEPTSNLDRASADVILALLAEFHRGGGTVVAASHDPALDAVATQTLRLAAGRVADMRFAVPGGKP